jgi:hypothetical protein
VARLTDADILLERDLLILELDCRGRSREEVARAMDVTPRMIARRLEGVPPKVREMMEALIREADGRLRADYVTDAEKDGLRAELQKVRRAAGR